MMCVRFLGDPCKVKIEGFNVGSTLMEGTCPCIHRYILKCGIWVVYQLDILCDANAPNIICVPMCVISFRDVSEICHYYLDVCECACVCIYY